MSENSLTTETQTPETQSNEKQATSYSSTWRTILSTFILVVWILVNLGLFVVVKWFFPKKLDKFFMNFHKGCCWIFSMRCVIKGNVTSSRPTLFLANHISYLDIFVFGSVIPGYFIAKSEVANWPILGPLAKVQNTLFFERKGRKVKSQLPIMTEHFDNEGNLILFPEGTSTEGEHVEPFKPSLLQSIETAKKPVEIQPVTIAYTRYKDEPMDRAIRDHYAWYATMPFASHFFSALGMANSQVDVIFHEPVKLSDFETRKECAYHCWQVVSESLAETLSQQ
jgi:1-acyl-sn-glycerol-3-phosphate acyltransferase